MFEQYILGIGEELNLPQGTVTGMWLFSPLQSSSVCLELRCSSQPALNQCGVLLTLKEHAHKKHTPAAKTPNTEILEMLSLWRGRQKCS